MGGLSRTREAERERDRARQVAASLPVARQHRFIHHRDEEGTSGVEESGEELEAPWVVGGLLAAFGRHGRGLEARDPKEGNKVASRGGAVPGSVTARVRPGWAPTTGGGPSNTIVTGSHVSSASARFGLVFD